MRARVALAALVAVALSAGCTRADQPSTPVTSTSPAGSSVAPSSADAKGRDEALLRIVQAVPADTQLDLFAGDLALFDGIGFKSVTPYRAIDGQRYAFALRPSGMPKADPLSSNTEGLHDGSYYTAFALPGTGRTPELRIVTDRLAAPSAGTAALRIAHAGLDAGDITIRRPGTNDDLFDKVSFQTISDYREIAPMKGPLEISSGDRVLTGFTAQFDAGRHYTIVIVGNAKASPRLEAFLIEDALAP